MAMKLIQTTLVATAVGVTFASSGTATPLTAVTGRIAKRDTSGSSSFTACTGINQGGTCETFDLSLTTSSSSSFPCVNFDSTLAGNVLSVTWHDASSKISFYSSPGCSAATGALEFDGPPAGGFVSNFNTSEWGPQPPFHSFSIITDPFA